MGGGGGGSRRNSSRDRKRDDPSCCCASRAKKRQEAAGGESFKPRGQVFCGKKKIKINQLKGHVLWSAFHSSSPTFMTPQFSACSLSPRLVKDVDELQQRRSSRTHARRFIKVPPPTLLYNEATFLFRENTFHLFSLPARFALRAKVTQFLCPHPPPTTRKSARRTNGPQINQPVCFESWGHIKTYEEVGGGLAGAPQLSAPPL